MGRTDPPEKWPDFLGKPREADPSPPDPDERDDACVCKVCGNKPDEDGWLEHGRGCYVLDADGGGSEYVGPRVG